MQIKYVQLRREFLIGRQNILQGQTFYNLLGRKKEKEPRVCICLLQLKKRSWRTSLKIGQLSNKVIIIWVLLTDTVVMLRANTIINWIRKTYLLWAEEIIKSRRKMRDLFTFWKRQYSAVDTSDALPPTQVVIGDACRADDAVSRGRKNSFLPGGRRMSLDQGIPPIIDSFFYQRKTGEKTRQPKRKFR